MLSLLQILKLKVISLHRVHVNVAVTVGASSEVQTAATTQCWSQFSTEHYQNNGHPEYKFHTGAMTSVYNLQLLSRMC